MFNMFTAFAFTLFGLSAVQAAPIRSDQITGTPQPPAVDGAFCIAELSSSDHGAPFGSYMINIGRPFNANGCDAINKTLNADISDGIYGYTCTCSTSCNVTNIIFQTATSAEHNIQSINALQKAYPMVPFQEQRICLMDGVAVPGDWPAQPAAKRELDVSTNVTDLNHNCSDKQPDINGTAEGSVTINNTTVQFNASGDAREDAFSIQDALAAAHGAMNAITEGDANLDVDA